MSTGLKTLQSYTFFNGNMLKNLQNHITIAPLNIKIQKNDFIGIKITLLIFYAS